MFRYWLLIAIALISNPVTAQLFPSQCSQEETPGDCSTCHEVIGYRPVGSIVTLEATKCPDTPTADCMPCCWDVVFTFEPGTSTVWYEKTYLQFGGTAEIMTGAGTTIVQRKTTACSTGDGSSSCVTGVAAFDLGFFPNTICLQLECHPCPAGTG